MSSIASIRSKIERTEHHVKDLKSAVERFFATDPYKVGTKRDPQTRRLVYYITEVKEVTSDVTLIASDVLCNLISVLDHLAYRLFVKGGTGGDGRHVYFPIARNAKTLSEYVTARQGKVQGIPATAIAAMDALEPYQGGKGHSFWVMNELNNLSKHRELITVGSQYHSMDIIGHLASIFGKTFNFPVKGIAGFIKPADTLCPLKVGDEIFGDLPDAEVNNDLQFKFEVSLNEPQIIHAQPLLETVYQFF